MVQLISNKIEGCENDLDRLLLLKKKSVDGTKMGAKENNPK